MRGHAVSPISGLLKLTQDQGLLYPKIVVRLEFHYMATDGEATMPPNQAIASVAVVHKLGLIGEYEWLQLF
jgi:hypothetical protein